MASDQNRRQINLRERTGQSLVDSPYMLLLILIVFAFPLLNLATTGFRSWLVSNAVVDASRRASCALTYMAPTKLPAESRLSNVPAVTVALQTLRTQLSGIHGVRLDDVKVGIVVIKNGNQASSGPFYAPIKPAEIDPFTNNYYIRVETLSEVEPLTGELGSLLGAMPGLTSPFILKTQHQEIARYPKGLSH